MRYQGLAIIDGNVIYTTMNEASLFELHKVDLNRQDPVLWKTPVAKVLVLNGQLVCRLSDNDDYGAVMLDGSGRLLLEVADPISRVFTSDDGVLLQNSRDSSIVLIR